MILQERPSDPYVPAPQPDSPATAPGRSAADPDGGRMRIEKNVPREVYCPQCATRMTPSSTPKLFRWFKCRDCGHTHRHWREFDWVDFSRSQ